MSGLEEVVRLPKCKCDENYYWRIRDDQLKLLGAINSTEHMIRLNIALDEGEYEFGIINLNVSFGTLSLRTFIQRIYMFECAGCGITSFSRTDAFNTAMDIIEKNWEFRTFRY